MRQLKLPENSFWNLNPTLPMFTRATCEVFDLRGRETLGCVTLFPSRGCPILRCLLDSSQRRHISTPHCLLPGFMWLGPTSSSFLVFFLPFDFRSVFLLKPSSASLFLLPFLLHLFLLLLRLPLLLLLPSPSSPSPPSPSSSPPPPSSHQFIIEYMLLPEAPWYSPEWWTGLKTATNEQTLSLEANSTSV